jgi:hypothetical protein
MAAISSMSGSDKVRSMVIVIACWLRGAAVAASSTSGRRT